MIIATFCVNFYTKVNVFLVLKIGLLHKFSNFFCFEERFEKQFIQILLYFIFFLYSSYRANCKYTCIYTYIYIYMYIYIYIYIKIVNMYIYSAYKYI